MGQENLNVPKNSFVIIMKFKSEADRTNAIRSEQFSKTYGELAQLTISNNGEINSKTSKN